MLEGKGNAFRFHLKCETVQKIANHTEVLSPSQSTGTVCLAMLASLNQHLKERVTLFNFISNMKYQHQVTRVVPP
jgi:hypothetical protein